MSGKGDTPRPGDSQRYREEYDRIFGDGTLMRQRWCSHEPGDPWFVFVGSAPPLRVTSCKHCDKELTRESWPVSSGRLHPKPIR